MLPLFFYLKSPITALKPPKPELKWAKPALKALKPALKEGERQINQSSTYMPKPALNRILVSCALTILTHMPSQPKMLQAEQAIFGNQLSSCKALHYRINSRRAILNPDISNPVKNDSLENYITENFPLGINSCNVRGYCTGKLF